MKLVDKPNIRPLSKADLDHITKELGLDSSNTSEPNSISTPMDSTFPVPTMVDVGQRHDTLRRLARELAPLGFGAELIKGFVSYYNQELSKPKGEDEVQRIVDWAMTKSLTVNGSNVPSLNFHTLESLTNGSLPEPSQIIGKGLLPEQTILLISGPPKTGKTSLVLNLSLCLVGGSDWFDFPIKKPSKVMIFQSEMANSLMAQRLKVMKSNCSFSIPEDHLLVSDSTRIDMRNNSHFHEVVDKITSLKPDVVIFDPLIGFHQAEENSNNEMQQVMDRFRDIASMGYAVILVHHSKKVYENVPISNSRGASAIVGAVDSFMNLSTCREGIQISFTLRYDQAPPELELSLDGSTLWFNSLVKDKERRKMLELIRQSGSSGMYKKELVNEIVQEFEVDRKTVYNWINNLIKERLIRTDGKRRNGKIYIE